MFCHKRESSELEGMEKLGESSPKREKVGEGPSGTLNIFGRESEVEEKDKRLERNCRSEL